MKDTITSIEQFKEYIGTMNILALQIIYDDVYNRKLYIKNNLECEEELYNLKIQANILNERLYELCKTNGEEFDEKEYYTYLCVQEPKNIKNIIKEIQEILLDSMNYPEKIQVVNVLKKEIKIIKEFINNMKNCNSKYVT